jgi:hypothetical protein
VAQLKVNPDGVTGTYVATGFNVIIFFPGDVPAGPSTILYQGKLVVTLDLATFAALGVQQVSGTQTDICAALSQ